MSGTDFNKQLDDKFTKLSKLSSANEHPAVRIAVTIAALFASVGGGGAFFTYLGDKETARVDSQSQYDEQLRAKIQIELKLVDTQEKLAGAVLIMSNQGKQIRELHKAIGALARGSRRDARQTIEGIEIPDSQGLPVVNGKAIAAPGGYIDRRAVLEAELQQLTK